MARALLCWLAAALAATAATAAAHASEDTLLGFDDAFVYDTDAGPAQPPRNASEETPSLLPDEPPDPLHRPIVDLLAMNGTRLLHYNVSDEENADNATLDGFGNYSLSQDELQRMAREGAGLDAALSLWEPRALAGAWSSVRSAVEEPCRRRLAALLAALPRSHLPTHAWAARAMDASGRYSRRLHSGNGFWLGSKELCRGEEGEDSPAPFPLAFHVAKVTLSHPLLPAKGHGVHVGLCLPAECSADDTAAALVALWAAREGGSALAVDDVRVVRGRYSLLTDVRFLLMAAATIVVVILVVAATLYDFWLSRKSVENPSLNNTHDQNNNNANNINYNITAQNNNCIANLAEYKANVPGAFDKVKNMKFYSLNTKKYTINNCSPKAENEPVKVVQKKTWKWREDVSDSIPMQMLLSFSLRTNIRKLCSLESGDDTLTPIHGLRVLTLMWIVLVHACLILFQNADNKQIRQKAEQEFLYQTLSSGTYSVDTFFVISGMLVSFLYFRTVNKFTVRELTFTEGYKAGVMQFIGMMVYRFIRLTPPYLYVLGIVSISMKYYNDHAMMELPTKDHINCEKYWWRNMVYLNTFYSTEERCMSWSWYLANDTQFYTVGIALLILSVSYFQTAVTLAGFILLSTWTTTALVTINTQHKPSIEDPFANYEDLYDKPWTRIGPYLIGMCAGWVLCKIDCQLNIRKRWVLFLWALAFAMMGLVMYCLYLVDFGPVLSAIYVALSHSAWALAISWIVIACSTGNGGIINEILSWPYFYPISRLSYCTYLIHPQLMRIIYLNYDSSFHIKIDMMSTVFWGFLVLSYFTALFITLTFEAPIVSLLRIAHPMRRKESA